MTLNEIYKTCADHQIIKRKRTNFLVPIRYLKEIMEYESKGLGCLIPDFIKRDIEVNDWEVVL